MIFLDTGYFHGLMDKKEIHHEDSMKIRNQLNELNETTVINTTVMVETLNSTVGSRKNLKKTYENICAENMVIPLTKNDYLKSLEINGWYSNTINYSDCTILTTMMEMGITRIVSFDACFKKIGKYEVISTA